MVCCVPDLTFDAPAMQCHGPAVVWQLQGDASCCDPAISLLMSATQHQRLGEVVIGETVIVYFVKRVSFVFRV
jgi:hypothetical protein